MNEQAPGWEREVVQNLAVGALREQRARRRWGVFFRLLFWGYVVSITALVFLPSSMIPGVGGEDEIGPHVALVAIEGVIAPDSPTAADRINRLLEQAFEDEDSRAVIMRVNSPGGSPAQSNRIYKEARRLRALHPDKKLFAVVDDIAASGGYFVAAAADEIYVDETSLVGSIGVIFSGFGFVGALSKLGIERRVTTAGESKNQLDPFSPENPADRESLRAVLESVHGVFKRAVREGRGARLTAEDRAFEGAFFAAGESLRLGLVDGYGDAAFVAREIVGVDEVIEYIEEDFFQTARRAFDLLGRSAARLWSSFAVGAQLR